MKWRVDVGADVSAGIHIGADVGVGIWVRVKAILEILMMIEMRCDGGVQWLSRDWE